ncbi:MAG TPA: hypothetical protein VEW93_02110 [Acidimicrobiales bacterium]|nr:hypothetical protein [Acidimicrobiales bacterium]
MTTTTPPPRSGRRVAGLAGGLLLVGAVLAGAALGPAEAAPVEVPAVPAAEPCAVTATLVNPCRPWLGVVADHYPDVGRSMRAQYEGHERRIGRQVDVVHWYHAAGNVRLSADERHVAERGSILYLNWKPANRWADATGGNASIDAQIDTMASQVRALGSARIMLSLFGEPERFATPGTSACPGLKGSAGSPADYRAMWAHVQDRFAAAGVTNVVWVMNYLGYVGWDCLFPELWPGNDRVDWVMWDPYFGPGRRWEPEVGYFYDALEAKADAQHAYTSKPWGLAEWGSWRNAPQAEAYRVYDDARATLDSGRFPRLKLYEAYDTTNGSYDIRVGYTGTGVADPTEQARYNAFAHHPAFSDPTGPTDPPDPPPPPPPPPPPTDHLAACDTGVETGISCFAGIYSGSVRPTLQAGGQAGARSVQVANTSGATGTLGLNVKPTPVAATVTGRTYTGAVWVRASRIGLPVTLILRERRPATGAAPANGFRTVTWTATDTDWHQITGTYVAKEAGNQLTYSVYASLRPAEWFRADTFALTSEPPG